MDYETAITDITEHVVNAGGIWAYWKMNYETAITETVTREAAIQEIELHGEDVHWFLHDLGDRAHYSGLEVLEWLGY